MAEFQQLEGAGAKSAFALKKAMLPAVGVLGGLATGLGLATKAAVEDQKAQDLLAQQLRTSAMATDDVIAQNEQFISSMSMSKAVADDELRPAMANLVRSTGSVEVAQNLMNTALDIAAATGKDLETVTMALGKAANGQTAALTKLDPSLKGVIDSSSTLDDITNALSVSFGGAADVAAQSYEGRMKSMKIAMDETKESIGAALLPALQKLLEILQPVAKWAQENTTLFLIIAGTVGGLAAAIVVANVAIKAWTIATQVATAAQAAFNFVMSANPIALVILAIVAFVAALVMLYKKFEVVRTVVDTVFNAIKTGVTVSLDFLTSYFEGVLNIYKNIFNAIAKLWNNTIGKLSFKFPDWVPGFGGKSFSVPNIPMLAEGGIVNSPTLAMIGEKGPEAVVPLNRNSGVGGITVNVNGGLSTSAEIGQAVVNAIRAYNRSAGPAQIQVA
ncbi:MAG: hypothetical protein EB142_06775 [Actinobacteria bacterium]|nr:hypothetical protein [Actinomycetota bacterium]